ncbi:methylated-DNA--[protein]-cysteine S-methyltransferase [Pseudonocardia sp. TRM90224]|uniref:methylated-DNA--[protein]-cysteine S-methyltransferase n=1 Tax=Pseudonocardia sp. TRM90224 TaxID=2812678 RepID=UPI001E4EF4F3|nr:methylated-DNA--[protein]-cysteine S-methyltransferase [Pseudonocardia sp. TRM90224]
MTDPIESSMVSSLMGLAAQLGGLAERVFASWTAAPSRAGAVFVAFTDVGVGFVRTAESVGDDPARFLDAYRARFGRPLREAGKPPRGLLPALRGTGRPPELDLRGLTAFEQAVLAATARVPAGQTRPYGWVAREAGNPGAVRAAASVLARNPVPLLVPCHRVVRADGQVGEYLFGGERKKQLLRAESVNLDEVAAFARAGVHFIGSDTTGVVCFPTCHNARRITPAHRHGFRTLATAVRDGYRPCKRCRPGVAA